MIPIKLYAYLSSIRSESSSLLWIAQLSMTRTEFAAGYGFIKSRRSRIKSINVSFVNEPSRILMCRIPSSLEIAGRMENLEKYTSEQQK